MTHTEPPASKSAEAAVLGSMAIDPQAIPIALEMLKAIDFYWTANQIIFVTFVELYNENDGAVDAVLLRNRLEKRGELEKVGGIEYLRKVLESVPTSANIQFYAQLVKTKSLERNMLYSTTKLSPVVNYATVGLEEKREAFEQANFELQTTESNRVEHIKDVAMEVYETASDESFKSMTQGLPTGFIELDEMTRGFSGGQLIILAGRTSMGKTALALTMALNMALDERRPMIFSMEMDNKSLVERLLASYSRVDLHSLKNRRIDKEGWTNLANAVRKFAEIEMWFDGTATQTPASLTTRVLAAKARFEIDCVFVDYIQLMRATGRAGRKRHEELSEISRQLKALARKANLPIIVLAQLGRKVDERPDHRPRLTDLKESGAIEENADIVLLLYREDYYRERDRKKGKEVVLDGEAVCITAKHRQGPTGDVALFWVPEITTFQNPPTKQDENFFEGDTNES